MANQDIMHLSHSVGGRPFCERGSARPRGVMSTTVEEASNWPRICKRCEARLAAMRERAARREAA